MINRKKDISEGVSKKDKRERERWADSDGVRVQTDVLKHKTRFFLS